jgi:hypothetical protein
MSCSALAGRRAVAAGRLLDLCFVLTAQVVSMWLRWCGLPTSSNGHKPKTIWLAIRPTCGVLVAPSAMLTCDVDRRGRVR